MLIPLIGAGCFGFVVGWITYRTLRRKSGTGISDIATVIGAIGGAAITGLFKNGDFFGAYAIGLFIGFIAYLVVASRMKESDGTLPGWMGEP